jgi:peroxiredoxin
MRPAVPTENETTSHKRGLPAAPRESYNGEAMKKETIKPAVVFILLVALLLGGWLMRGFLPAGFSKNAVQSSREVRSMPALDLPVPESASDRSYLGITGTGYFKTTGIDARVLIIEFFDFYCPHCQRTAPRMNEVYDEIERRADLRGRVKILGIGVGDTPFEVRSFKEKFHVPFPMFADKERKITKGIVIPGTPMFMAVKPNGAGSHERFFLWTGEFEDASRFLSGVVKGL